MKRHPVLHPILLAINFLLVTIAQNLAHYEVSDVFRAVPVVLLLAVAALIAFYALFREWNRAGLAASLLILLMLYYNFISGLLHATGWQNGVLESFIVLCGLCVMLVFASTSSFVWKNIKVPHSVTDFLNVICLAILLVPLFTIFSQGTAAKGTKADEVQISEWTLLDIPTTTQDAPDNLPDIYYIILDGYGRSDVLQEIYGYDNSALITFLRDQGFYVAEQGSSNYSQTVLSLGASLNLRYLDEYVQDFDDELNRGPLGIAVRHSTVRHFLEDQGYQVAAISTGYNIIHMSDAEVSLAAKKQTPYSEFEVYLLSQSIVSPLIFISQSGPFWPDYDFHRTRVHYAFDQLQQVPAEINGPKFVFAHILSPHPPFVFDTEGNPVDPGDEYRDSDGSHMHDGDPQLQREYIADYAAQITYIDQLIIETVDAILTLSDRPPIIILQGDHGPGALLDYESLDATCVHERLSILNAYYAPEVPESGFYPEITPVNSFRVIFNSYFGTELEMLEDRSYYSTWSHPYTFIDVTDSLSTPCLLP